MTGVTGVTRMADPGPRRRTATPTDLRLLGPAVVGWAVAAATLALSPGAHLAAAGLAVLLGMVVLAATRGRQTAWRGPALVLCLLLVVLQVTAAAHAVLRVRGGVDDLARARAVVTADLVVTGDAVVVAGRGEGSRVLRTATMRRVTARGGSSATDAPVLLTGDDRLVTLPWRATVRVTGRLAPTDPADDRAATLSVSGAPHVVAPPGAVAAAAEQLRAGLRTAVDGAPDDARGLLPGLVIGDTSRTPADLTEAMHATGMTHLTAVSGSNVAIVTGLVLGLCILLGVPRGLRPAIALAALAGFVVLARPEPSVVRAAVMGAIGLIGLSRARRSAGPPVLGAAVVVVLVLDPWLARSYGFALSCLATLGLLLFTRPWGEAIGTRLPPRLAPLGPALAVPVAAQAMTAPVVVLLQGSVSVVGVVANLLAAPLVPVATVAGVAAALVSVPGPEVPSSSPGSGSSPRRDRAGRPGDRAGPGRHDAVARRLAGRRAPRGADPARPAHRALAGRGGRGAPGPDPGRRRRARRRPAAHANPHLATGRLAGRRLRRRPG